MFITEREVKRIVSTHFREKYNIEINPERMKWDSNNYDLDITGLNVEGGIVIEKNDTNSSID